MKVALIGDAHGDLTALAQAVQLAHSQYGAAAAIQFGDLGFREDLLGAGRSLPHLPIPVYALCGNHEDHEFLARARHEGLWRRWAAHGLIYQPRGSLLSLGGRMVGFLGGAMHVDRPQEALNRPSAEQVQQAIAAFSGARPALIATHSCPAGIGVGMCGSDAFVQSMHDHVRRAGIDPGPPDDCGEPGLSTLWNALAPRPPLWVFGHFHRFHEARVGTTHFVSCPALGQPGPVLIWDSADSELSIHTPEYR